MQATGGAEAVVFDVGGGGAVVVVLGDGGAGPWASAIDAMIAGNTNYDAKEAELMPYSPLTLNL